MNPKYDIPMLTASPTSCTASEIMATLPVKTPPTNSKTEKARFNINAIRMLLSDFITPPVDNFLKILYNKFGIELNVH